MEFTMSPFWHWYKHRATFFTLLATVTCFLVMLIFTSFSGQADRTMCLETMAEAYRQPRLPRTTKRQILLVTHGRSGSSFTSALIHGHQDVFFAYEPLVVLQAVNQPVQYGNQQESVEIVNAFLTCNVLDYHIHALENFQLKQSDSTRDFSFCINDKHRYIPDVSCYLALLHLCQSRQVTFVKTIRFQIKWAEPFLESNPNFRLLYLVRDPRATLFSQARVFRNFDWTTEIRNYSRQHCTFLENDLKEADRLKKLYPGQVKGIRYEEGALDPFSYTKDIYNFLGLKYSKNIATVVQKLTNASRDDPEVKRAYSVKRHNSSETMDRWRFGAGYKSVSEIDKNCRHLYSRLGYKHVHSQRDLESTRSLIDKPEFPGIFS